MTTESSHRDFDSKSLLELVGMIYDAVADNTQWTFFLEALARATQCSRGAFILVGGPERAVTCYYGWTSEDIRLWVERYSASDSWRLAAENVPQGEVWTSLELCPQEVFEQCPAYREFYQSRNCVFGIGGSFLRTEHGNSALSLSYEKESAALVDIPRNCFCNL
jgi:hypothetical protein